MNQCKRNRVARGFARTHDSYNARVPQLYNVSDFLDEIISQFFIGSTSHTFGHHCFCIVLHRHSIRRIRAGYTARSNFVFIIRTTITALRSLSIILFGTPVKFPLFGRKCTFYWNGKEGNRREEMVRGRRSVGFGSYCFVGMQLLMVLDLPATRVPLYSASNTTPNVP